eukprot:TRINITY_DN23023_c0_g1_i1.p1 TRINITY_DN23023_c0_g1~~TRINITY_DN23023_c0_g1_i1.p1  ORF type:complete len:111 (-),score=14.64 TRINITY_DN23023_c0_g1_i1:38-370(-)
MMCDCPDHCKSCMQSYGQPDRFVVPGKAKQGLHGHLILVVAGRKKINPTTGIRDLPASWKCVACEKARIKKFSREVSQDALLGMRKADANLDAIWIEARTCTAVPGTREG